MQFVSNIGETSLTHHVTFAYVPSSQGEEHNLTACAHVDECIALLVSVQSRVISTAPSYTLKISRFCNRGLPRSITIDGWLALPDVRIGWNEAQTVQLSAM